MHKFFIEGCWGGSMSVQTKPVQAYCVKCRTKRDIMDPQVTTLKNGKPATKGKCPTCGTNMFRIGKI